MMPLQIQEIGRISKFGRWLWKGHKFEPHEQVYTRTLITSTPVLPKYPQSDSPCILFCSQEMDSPSELVLYMHSTNPFPCLLLCSLPTLASLSIHLTTWGRFLVGTLQYTFTCSSYALVLVPLTLTHGIPIQNINSSSYYTHSFLDTLIPWFLTSWYTCFYFLLFDRWLKNRLIICVCVNIHICILYMHVYLYKLWIFWHKLWTNEIVCCGELRHLN